MWSAGSSSSIAAAAYFPYEGNYSTYLEEEGQAAGAGRARGIGQAEGDQARELEWIRQAQGRQTKSKARIAFENSLPRRKPHPRQGADRHSGAERLGGKVIEVKNISKAYGDKLLFEDLSFTLPPGGIVGVIGPNGAGKSTLFKITGKEKPDSRHVEIGSTVHLGYVDQSRDHLDGTKNVWEEISGGRFMKVNKHDEHPRLCRRVQLQGQDQQKKVGKLSGGERNRVHMAKMLKTGGNVLLLDEPTNDLDVETLGALEDAIEEFRRLRRGHQPRPLLPRPPCTTSSPFEGDSHVEWFEGQLSRPTRKTSGRRLKGDGNQALPSVYLRVAKDADGDGVADIWRSQADALASIANYFVDAGWRKGQAWGMAVSVPGTLNRASVGNRLTPPRCPRVFERFSRWMTVAEWRALGVVPMAAPALSDDTLAVLLEPDGPGRTGYLLTSNYEAILDYNCSNFYALSVGLLADGVAK
jgi:ABC-type lipoprotein export system ATPase subunit